MEALGINLGHIIIYSVLLGFLFWMVKKKLVPSLDAALVKRQNEIDKGIAAGKKAEEVEEEARKKSQMIVDEAKAQRQRIISKYEEEAETEAKDIVGKARIRAQRIIEEAEEIRAKERRVGEKEAEEIIKKMAREGKIKIVT